MNKKITVSLAFVVLAFVLAIFLQPALRFLDKNDDINNETDNNSNTFTQNVTNLYVSQDDGTEELSPGGIISWELPARYIQVKDPQKDSKFVKKFRVDAEPTRVYILTAEGGGALSNEQKSQFIERITQSSTPKEELLELANKLELNNILSVLEENEEWELQNDYTVFKTFNSVEVELLGGNYIADITVSRVVLEKSIETILVVESSAEKLDVTKFLNSFNFVEQAGLTLE